MNFTNYLKAVFFDLDGVILDTEVLYMTIMVKYNQAHNLFISKDFYIKNLLGKSQQTISNILNYKWGKQYNEKEYWDGLLKYRNNYLSENKIKIKKGFNELLFYLKKNNYYVGIVTSNSFQLTRQLLKSANIDIKKFNLIVTRDDVVRVKPYPDLYNLALKKSGLNNLEVIVIEDSIVGVQSAIRAHLNVIHVPDVIKIDDELRKNCLMIIESLQDLKKYLMNNGGQKWK